MNINHPSMFFTPPPLTRGQEMFLSVLFVAFLYFCFVGLLPFGPRNPYQLSETGKGDIVQQVLYISVATGFLSFTMLAQDWRIFRLIGLWIALSMGWILLSVTWSGLPDLSFRRSVFTVIVLLTVFSSVSLLGPEKILKLLFYTTLTLIIASLISGPTIHNAIHREGMRGAEDLVGRWRGVFIHKNKAGAASALLIIFSFQQLVYGNIIKKKLHLWMGLAAGIPMLFLAFSKTSIILLFPSLAISALFMFFVYKRDYLHRAFLALLIILSIYGLSIFIYNSVDEILSDPESFTGRSAIWSALFKMISDHPIRGYGYSSVFEVGTETPLRNYAADWVERVAHAHNGYLQVAVEQGLVGLFLAFTGFVVIPLATAIFSRKVPKEFLSIYLAVATFFVFHNMLETTIMDRDSLIWVVYTIILASFRYLHQANRTHDPIEGKQQDRGAE